MKIKEVTFRKCNAITLKDNLGNYRKREADISLTVEAENGKVDESEITDKLKQLVESVMGDDPSWLEEGDRK